MPKMTVTLEGEKPQELFLSDARVEIFHGAPDELRDMQLVQTIQFIVRLPFNESASFAKWALAPAGKKRFAKVEMEIFSRDLMIQRMWVLPRAYVYHYRELEFMDSTVDETEGTSHESEFRLVIRGIIENNMKYDGQNLAQVNAGGSRS